MVLLYDERAGPYCPINYTTLNHVQLRGVGCNIIQANEKNWRRKCAYDHFLRRRTHILNGWCDWFNQWSGRPIEYIQKKALENFLKQLLVPFQKLPTPICHFTDVNICSNSDGDQTLRAKEPCAILTHSVSYYMTWLCVEYFKVDISSEKVLLASLCADKATVTNTLANYRAHNFAVIAKLSRKGKRRIWKSCFY